MLKTFTLLFISFVIVIPKAFPLNDWNILTNMQRDDQGIPIPRNARTEEQKDDWPQPGNQWEEHKDNYTVRVPLRIPEDADEKFMTYKYSDGEVHITVPKKRLKSII